MGKVCPNTLHTAGSHLLIRGLLLRNAVLPSGQLVVSGLALPVPLAFNLSSSNSSAAGSNASLVLDGCTITATSCANLAQFASWLAAGASSSLVQVC